MLHTLLFSLQNAVYFIMLLFWFLYYSHFTYRVCWNLNVKLRCQKVNDTLLYRKPAYHLSCWLTQGCLVFEAQERPSENFAVTKAGVPFTVTMLQTWATSLCVSRLGENVASGITGRLMGQTQVARYPAVMLADMSALSRVSIKIFPISLFGDIAICAAVAIKQQKPFIPVWNQICP
jgi:hypothetical protein